MSDQLEYYEYLFRILQYKTCFICKINGPNYITPCSHTFHLSCLSYTYHHNPSQCPECRQEMILDFIITNTDKSCFSCKSQKLTQIFPCNHTFCAQCLLKKKNMLDCCKSVRNQYLDYTINCPLCEDEVRLTDCAEIICTTHGIICKKCHNYGFLNKECIGKCGCKIENAYAGFCFSCENQKIIHFSNKNCKNKCILCIDCYIWFLQNFGYSKKCYICSENLD